MIHESSIKYYSTKHAEFHFLRFVKVELNWLGWIQQTQGTIKFNKKKFRNVNN